MKITNIKQQVKRAGRYSIYVDGKYSFSLSEQELLNQGLRVGQEFKGDSFNQIQQTAVEDKAYMRALDMLARRPRSVWEMKQYLIRKGYNNNMIELILNKLSKRGLLDDNKFAELWVKNRRQLKLISKRKLLQELQQKRISNSIISSVLTAEQINDTDALKDLISKKSSLPRYQDKQKLMSYLLRQGFSYEDIKTCLK
jgi:regulatory protein